MNPLTALLKHPLANFREQNGADCLPDGALREMYLATEGPHGSPDPLECLMLHWLAKSCGGNAVEFGSWRGRSACFIASGLDHGCKLYAVDHFAGDETGGAGACEHSMRESLLRFDLDEKVEIISEDMNKVDVSRFRDVGMVFYDSDHNRYPTVKTLTRMFDVIKPGAVVAIHDANWQSSVEAIKELSAIYENHGTIPVWHGFCILRKPDK